MPDNSKEQLIAGMLDYLNSGDNPQAARAEKAEPKTKKNSQRRGKKVQEFSNTPSDNSRDVLKAKKRKELQALKAMSEARRKPSSEELRPKK